MSPLFPYTTLFRSDQHLGIGTAENQLRTAMISADFQQQGPYPVTHAEGFPRDQVFTGQQRFGVTTEIYNNVVPCHLLDGAGYQLTDAITVAVDNLHALGFANLLENNLLGSLGTDTSKGD